PAVLEAAVVGVPSEQWGETPVGFVSIRSGQRVDAAELRAWANEQLGKMQRLAAIEIVSSLPRSAIGKVLKRELRDQYKGQLA
ncbi:MAG: 4-coumarate--CoA ligase, partial [Steroidobacteraceae bacterium]